MKRYDKMSLRRLMESFLFEEDLPTTRGLEGDAGEEAEGSSSGPGIGPATQSLLDQYQKAKSGGQQSLARASEIVTNLGTKTYKTAEEIFSEIAGSQYLVTTFDAFLKVIEDNKVDISGGTGNDETALKEYNELIRLTRQLIKNLNSEGIEIDHPDIIRDIEEVQAQSKKVKEILIDNDTPLMSNNNEDITDATFSMIDNVIQAKKKSDSGKKRSSGKKSGSKLSTKGMGNVRKIQIYLNQLLEQKNISDVKIPVGEKWTGNSNTQKAYDKVMELYFPEYKGKSWKGHTAKKVGHKGNPAGMAAWLESVIENQPGRNKDRGGEGGQREEGPLSKEVVHIIPGGFEDNAHVEVSKKIREKEFKKKNSKVYKIAKNKNKNSTEKKKEILEYIKKKYLNTITPGSGTAGPHDRPRTLVQYVEDYLEEFVDAEPENLKAAENMAYDALQTFKFGVDESRRFGLSRGSLIRERYRRY